MRDDHDRAAGVKGLLTLFTFDRKQSLETYARSLVLHTGAFADVVTACQQGLLPFRHRAHYERGVKAALVSSHEEPQALTSNGVSPLVPVARKAVRKLRNLSRSWSAGHMFYTPDLHEWHFFAFDGRDQDSSNANHWAHGAHVHFVNWLWPHLQPEVLWSQFVSSRKKPGGSLHIRDDAA
jgi:hypothetical protein